VTETEHHTGRFGCHRTQYVQLAGMFLHGSLCPCRCRRNGPSMKSRKLYIMAASRPFCVCGQWDTVDEDACRCISRNPAIAEETDLRQAESQRGSTLGDQTCSLPGAHWWVCACTARCLEPWSPGLLGDWVTGLGGHAERICVVSSPREGRCAAQTPPWKPPGGCPAGAAGEPTLLRPSDAAARCLGLGWADLSHARQLSKSFTSSVVDSHTLPLLQCKQFHP
jgi:hypothetical protein